MFPEKKDVDFIIFVGTIGENNILKHVSVCDWLVVRSGDIAFSAKRCYSVCILMYVFGKYCCRVRSELNIVLVSKEL